MYFIAQPSSSKNSAPFYRLFLVIIVYHLSDHLVLYQTFMAQNDLSRADVPLTNYSLSLVNQFIENFIYT